MVPTVTGFCCPEGTEGLLLSLRCRELSRRGCWEHAEDGQGTGGLSTCGPDPVSTCALQAGDLR